MSATLSARAATDRLAHLGPNWFASVMGTGIVANAVVVLPVRSPAVRGAATAVWLLAALWLVALSAGFAVQWVRHRPHALAHHADPVMAQFYGAPPMAMLTVGAGTLLFGPDLIGSSAAVAVAWTLWIAGTACGLLSAVAVPYLMFTRHAIDRDAAFAGWLMPVVPPMVSAATGAALLPHLAAGQPRLSMLVACYAMFGISLLATVVILPQLWSRLAHHGPGAAATVPTLWIVLGPLGQSVTAAGNLGAAAERVGDAPWAGALPAFAVVYGVPVFGFALLWMALAAAITLRARRDGLGFALTWWSFTFPVGTCVTAAATLGVHSGAKVLGVVAVALYLGLLAAWVVVAARTVRGVLSGRLLAAPR
ncbi:MAG TPA: TDT family transporter [Stackebrandtia sp.]|uniref:TDT family transporter n=1 Tax=Stackebrandtia sp. TaxID=2023065 RepID=UPI002D28BF5D|nr:TDT family transporter [Stackebrandtia sp.]HZE40753.1 TDT family transporter [Stackebrandtia sp.]